MDLVKDNDEVKDVAISVADGRVPWAYTPPNIFNLPFELQEMEDVIAGDSVMNGMRYRYIKNPSQIKANGEVDWQYSSDAAEQIESIRKIMKHGKLDDKGIITFWKPSRDLHKFLRRLDGGYDSSNRQRHPCGLVWQLRGARGGFNVNVTNRSIWPLGSYSSDFHLPGVVAYYLGRNPVSFNAFVYRIKQAKRAITAIDFNVLVTHMTNNWEKYYQDIAPYKPCKTEIFHSHLAPATEAARVGHFANSFKLCKALPKKSMYRDWACTMSIIERMMQADTIKMNALYGIKSALQTKALNQSREFTVEKFYDLMWKPGVIAHCATPYFIQHMIKTGKFARHILPHIKDYSQGAMTGILLNTESLMKADNKTLRRLRLEFDISRKDFGAYA